jgi:hypothetical protein
MLLVNEIVEYNIFGALKPHLGVILGYIFLIF